MTEIPTLQLADGGAIPQLGFGTYPLDGDEGRDAVASALELGYRLIDTAAQYGNEEAVGAGITASGVARDELFVTTKLAGRDHGRDAVRPALEASLERLGLDRIDLYLIHWPNPSVGRYVESFESMLELQAEGLITHVGVSNFTAAQLTTLHEATGVFPAVDQIQLSPRLARQTLRSFLGSNRIVAQAWGPLGNREGLPAMEVVHDVAAAHGATVGQVLLAWHLQHGIVAIPKAASEERQRENLGALDVTLTRRQLDDLTALDLGESAAWDSNVHEEL